MNFDRLQYGIPAIAAFSIATMDAAPPIRVPSIGPNGTHWPDLLTTPYMYDVQTHDIEVACSWTAISDALAGIDGTEAAAGVRILVQPGTLTGFGSGGGSTSVITDKGSESWTKRVVVTPRDGYGTVTIASGAKFTRVHAVAWCGFISSGGMRFSGCNKSAVARILNNGYSAIASLAGTDVDLFEVAEWVDITSQVVDSDVMQCIADDTQIANVRWDGCYIAPNARTIGSVTHCDTLQFFKTGDTSWFVPWDMEIRDSVLWASNNCAVQTGGIDGLIIRNSLLFGASQTFDRYPVGTGGDTTSIFPAINGAGNRFQAIDSYIAGTMAMSTGGGAFDGPWSYVENTRTKGSITGLNAPESGAWIQDSNSATYAAVTPAAPTSGSLLTLWAAGATIPDTQADPATFSHAGVPTAYWSPPTITISTVESNSPTIRDELATTTDGSQPVAATPTGASSAYTVPFALTSNATTQINAIVQAPGETDSAMASVTYEVGLMRSNSTFKNMAMPSAQTGAFTFRFRVRPDTAPLDSIITLSDGAAANGTYTALLVSLRLNTSGFFDARNGGVYAATNSLAYESGASYDCRLVIDVATDTYDAYVAPVATGVEVQIADSYAFRSAAAELDNVCVVTQGLFTALVSNFSVDDGEDLTAPTISSVVATPFATSCVITWTTNEPATSQVEYGTTVGLGSATTEDTAFVTSHSVTITGLTPGTTYHFRPESEDSSGNRQTGVAIDTFETEVVVSPPGDGLPSGGKLMIHF